AGFKSLAGVCRYTTNSHDVRRITVVALSSRAGIGCAEAAWHGGIAYSGRQTPDRASLHVAGQSRRRSLALCGDRLTMSLRLPGPTRLPRYGRSDHRQMKTHR